MTIEEREKRIARMESLLEKPAENDAELGKQLAEIWIDELWQVSDDSFEEFLGNEFQLTEAQAFSRMKLAADQGVFTPDIAEKIEFEFERLT